MENRGILYVFPVFHSAWLAKKIRCPAADDLFRDSLVRDHGVDGVLHQDPADKAEPYHAENQVKHGAVLCRHTALLKRRIQLFSHFVGPVDAVNAACNEREQESYPARCPFRWICQLICVIVDFDKPVNGLNAESDDGKDNT